MTKLKSYSVEQLRTPRAPVGVGAQKGACLYYPNFSVQSDLWAKQALLFWDFIATIIPKDVSLSAIAESNPHFSGTRRGWCAAAVGRRDAGKGTGWSACTESD
jgi:hypothetical protein